METKNFSQFSLVQSPTDQSWVVGYSYINGANTEIRVPYPSIASIGNAVALAQTAADTATTKAAAAATSATNAATSEANAADVAEAAITETGVNLAATRVAAQETFGARDAALALANRYPDTGAALADGALANGKYFSTPSPIAGESAIILRKLDGAAIEGPHLSSADSLRYLTLLDTGLALVDARGFGVRLFDGVGQPVALRGAKFSRVGVEQTIELDIGSGGALAFGGFEIVELTVDVPPFSRVDTLGFGRFPTATVDPSAVIAEVTAARGSKASLEARLSAANDGYGLPLDAVYGARYMRRTPAKLRALLRGMNTQLIYVLGPADSWTHMKDRYSGPLAKYLRAKYGDAGPGWTGFGYIDSLGTATRNGNVNYDEVLVTHTGTGWTGQYYSLGTSPDLGAATSSTAGDRIRVQWVGAGNISAIPLRFTGGGGAIRYSWDNGATWTPLTLSGSGAQIVNLAGIPAGTWTLILEVVSGTCQLMGCDLQKSGPGVRVHCIAATGSDSTTWSNSSKQAGLQAAWSAFGAIDLFDMYLGTNDQGISLSYDGHEVAMTTLVATARAASAGVDVLLATPAENGRSSATYPQRLAGYAARDRKLAFIQKLTHLDMQPKFGATYADYGYGNAVFPTFGSDAIHPDAVLGGALQLDARVRLLENTL